MVSPATPGPDAAQKIPTSKDRLHERIESDFRYHPPRPDQLPLYNKLRDDTRALAHTLIDCVPEGRELSTALTKLEECVMQANAGIARHG